MVRARPWTWGRPCGLWSWDEVRNFENRDLFGLTIQSCKQKHNAPGCTLVSCVFPLLSSHPRRCCSDTHAALKVAWAILFFFFFKKDTRGSKHYWLRYAWLEELRRAKSKFGQCRVRRLFPQSGVNILTLRSVVKEMLTGAPHASS
jgi:hypothetical protein